MPKAVAYVRVSTAEQHPENQVRAVRALAEPRGLWELDVRTEVESAAKRRPVLEGIMAEARRGQVSALVVVALDRLDRSMQGTIARVLELDHLGVRVLSVREPWLDTAGPARSLMLAVFGWVAEQEREQIRSRTRAGMERARASGKHVGRPRASPVLLSAAADRVRAGGTVKGTARTLGLKEATLRAFMKAQKGPPVPAPADPHASGV